MQLLSYLFIIFYGNQQKPRIEPKRIENNRRVEVIDPRLTSLYLYLQKKQSPLMESAQSFIRIADKYKLDWTLLPAISGVESGFEKAGNLNDHNPFGYMCKSGPCYFSSFDESIEAVAHSIGTGNAYKAYRDSGSISVLARTYNYVSPEDWTSKIKYFQEEMGVKGL